MTSLFPSCFESLLGANIYSADYRRDRIPGLQTHPLWHLQVVLGHLPTLPIVSGQWSWYQSDCCQLLAKGSLREVPGLPLNLCRGLPRPENCQSLGIVCGKWFLTQGGLASSLDCHKIEIPSSVSLLKYYQSPFDKHTTCYFLLMNRENVQKSQLC